MCTILFLPKNVPIKEDSIRNMVLNNPDGFGLLFKDTDGTVKQVAREFYPDGTDPNRVIHMLKKYKQYDRLVHVRYNTVGHSSLDNTHPFEVFNNKKRTVYMMHNGTLYDYRPQDVSKSDSRLFAEIFLTPLLKEHTVNGDYYRGMLPKVIDKFVSTQSKIVLWGSHLEPLFIGPWIHEKNTDGSYHYSTSNNDYFTAFNRSRSVEARKVGTTSNFLPHYQNTGARTGNVSSVWNSAMGKFEDAKDRKFFDDDTEVGKSASGFFPHGRRVSISPESNESNLRSSSASLVNRGQTVPFKFKVPLSDINLQRKPIKEMVVEVLARIAKSFDDMDVEALFSTESYDMLMHVTNAEWLEVVKKHPESVGNLLTLLAYGCSDLETALVVEQRKSAKQQTIIDNAAVKLAEVGLKVQDVAA